MSLIRLTTVFLIGVFINSCFGANVRITFEKCEYKGFTCTTSKQVANKVDIVFQCNTTITGQDILIYLWGFNSPGTINSFEIHNCDNVRLSFHCSGENKPIQWLKIKGVKNLEIVPAVYTHNPPKIILENVSRVETLPRDTFSQIKLLAYKPGCFIPLNDLNEIEFTNVNIGTIETEAFRNLTDMKTFVWNNVTVNRTSVNAVQLSFIDGVCGIMNICNLNVVEPLAFRLTGEGFSITHGNFGDIWGSGINGTIYDFTFNNNTVANIQSGAISILAQNVYILDNHFQNIESGAFQKIGPGLLHDSKRNFGKLMFVYKFNSNLIETVGDGGIRPDVEAYKNVAADVTFTYNTMQCSCEGLTWLGADVDLGFGYSVIKDFHTMILDPQNSNVCTFTPCMCFGVRSPKKKTASPGTVF